LKIHVTDDGERLEEVGIPEDFCFLVVEEVLAQTSAK
jgi:hypothetical protein